MTEPDEEPPLPATSSDLLTRKKVGGIPSGWAIGVVVGLVILGLAGTARHVLDLERQLVETLAVADATKYTKALQEFRTIYTSEVVEPARANGIVITHDYLNTPGSLPLPATLTKTLGARLTAASGGDVRLYSDYPFPGSTLSGITMDEFQASALSLLRATPEKPVIRIVDNDGQLTVRYATSDRMREACVECHNTHPESPKRDWKVGDVRGVLEVTRPVSAATTTARLDLQRFIRQLTGIAILSLVGLALGIMGLRRSALRSIEHASETAKANQLLALEVEQRKNAEQQALAVQKLESLGLLAGGIAHDFNNLLSGILGNAELVKLEASKDQPKLPTIRRYIDLILQAGEQTKRLVKQLLTYAGGQAFEKKPVNLTQRIDQLSPLLATASRHKANLVLETDPLLPVLMGDPVQLDQVVMNLLTNASDAIQTTGGTITIRTGICAEDDTDQAEKAPEPSKGPPDNTMTIYLEVEDDGCGMDLATKNRMFDPFFSTKGIGRGLGLSALQGIVRDHDGTIMVASELGTGSIFRVEFRGAINVGLANQHPSQDGASLSELRRILVVDDDLTVLETTTSMLTEKGLVVESVSSGAQAIERIVSAGPKVDGVILDVCMPDEHGVTTYNKLIHHQPELPIMFMSGFALDEGVQTLVSQGRVGLLSKPFTLAELSLALEDLQTKASRS